MTDGGFCDKGKGAKNERINQGNGDAESLL